MTSVPFDSIAQSYDVSRGFPEQVAHQIACQIDQAANGSPHTRFLEVGVGTGRVAVPLVERGRQYTGIDISVKMLDQLFKKLYATGWQENVQAWGSLSDEDAMQAPTVRRFLQKQGAIRLVAADMTRLPFHDASFDAVIAVHVFHLVSEWQQALQEIIRVLRPGGVLVCCWEQDWHMCWHPGPDGDMRRQWSRIVQELGGSTELPGATEQVVTDWLQQQGFETEAWEALRWERKVTPRALFEGITQRIWTSTLSVPDSVFAASIERLNEWTEEHYGKLIDEQYTQEQRMMIGRTRI